MTDISRVTGPMTMVTDRLHFDTKGNADIVKLTPEIQVFITRSGLSQGSLTVFMPGATGAITTLEFEPGVVQDFSRLFDQIAPIQQHYEHNVSHLDHNGHAHVRAGLLGPSLVLPFQDGKLCLGTWQDVCFVCFDNEPRHRTVIVQAVGVAPDPTDTPTA